MDPGGLCAGTFLGGGSVEHTEDLLILQPGYTESAEMSMSHTYPACYSK